MTTRLTIADTTDVTATSAPDAVRFARATRRRIGVDVGDVVRVAGDDETVATVGDDAPDVPEDALLAGEAVERNAGANPGSTVSVDPVAVRRARTVTVSPARSFSLEGDPDALSRVLADHPLTVGDRIDADLFGGSVVVSLVVRDLDPSGPVVATPETTVVVHDDVIDTTVPTVPADDLGGLDDERTRLRRLIAAPLAAPEAYDTVGSRPPAGVLVHGPSGTGKTRLVRSVAAEADLPVRTVAPADCERRHTLSGVLDDAADAASAVVFVEDLAAAAPTDGGDGRRSNSQLGWLLDRVRDRDDLVVVGEATHADDVDPALRRGGRFDAEVRVGVPDAAGRREILAAHATDLRLAADVDLGAVASRTHGYTGADLEAVLVDAATRAVARAADGDAPVVRARDVEAALDAVGPTTLRDVTIERPSTTYRDIGGLDDAKREVIRAIEWPLRYPELFERLSADPPTGALLYGPPGTGKTMLAKAVANSTDANFLAVDGPELMDRYVGESERAVREMFERARRTAPSVVFLDELDALAPARRETDTGAAERVVSQLLTELDGVSDRGEVVVLAATNRRDGVDPALLRPGRIERQVAVPLPDEAARASILSIHLDDVPTRGVDLDALAAETEGYTGSDLAGAVREAALLAMEGHLRAERDSLDALAVEGTHLQRALERIRPSVDPDDW
ncbi:AAA family ATPase [Haloplanus natans]|uniref:AAA family ATPase n=1 Tax=Haloplanus natans TaxID=376171 RepID=UPI0006781909|nr:AAA family ATPase [Haloplanus natans]